ncbi:type VII secretion protein EccCa [Buchananella hordeovulneris]|uniref:type VII secretion protein EccCa n=1 Tax=Buchananella hordeovulneris TaxID=52770 RepID=UPI000F5F231C|nr:type VII secretion protein EccCa [Buchananella hordeovulneris]RRD51278.1 type VII secretion protein EccCa [Buchananella hordeovulneris]
MATLAPGSRTAVAPEMPEGQLMLQAPPDQAEPAGVGNILAMVLPMMGSMGVMAFMAFSQNSNPRMLLMAGGMVVAMLSMVGFNLYRQIGGHRKKVSTLRREYLAYLGEMRETVRTVAKQQRACVSWHLPNPDTLVLLTEDGVRLWERDMSDPGSLSVRLGTSQQDLAMELVEPELPALANPDVVCHSALSRFLAAHSTVDQMPFGVMLGDFSHFELCGQVADTRSQARALLTHLATFLSPEALRIAVLTTPEAASQWEWLKWLPHARSTQSTDALGAARLVSTDAAELAGLLGEELTGRSPFTPRGDHTDWPHLLLVLDGQQAPAGILPLINGAEGVTVVRLMASWGALTSRTTVRMVLRPGTDESDPGQMEVLLLDHPPLETVPDQMGLAQAEAVARRMLRWQTQSRPSVEAAVGQTDPKRSVDLMELLGIGDIRDFDPERQWRRREGRDRLRVPFGVTPEGVPVLIDIKEAAQQGMGPHGLLIGATGSGKSEVLRTIVLAMALTHSPEQLNFVLVDFKGGATFAGMADLPHVSAMISNLESELSLVDRMQDAIRGEMVRRQELLREAGAYANVTDYEADRRAGKHSCPPLPALFIILDEFSELLSAKPEFIEIFVAVGRLGRSMSIHLLLASQRLEAGRLRGLDSHLSYRLGLRTFSASESREVLGVVDAYELPNYPGVGYLKPGTDQMIRFRASYVAAPPPARQVTAGLTASDGSGREVKLLPFTVAPVLQREDTQVASNEPTVLPGDERWVGMSEIDIAVEQMRGKGTPAHQVWLPPLEVPETMDSLLGDLTVTPELGLHSPSWRQRGPLRIPLGIVDLPLEQRRAGLEVELAGANGHVGIIGGPLSGKSTALRSLVLALSLTHTPQEVQFYIIDLGGGTFASFEGAAHVAGVATRDRQDVINRMLAEIDAILADREKYFRAHRIDSITTYRRGRAAGQYDDGYGDVFLIVDGWDSLRADFDSLDMRIQTMMARALTFGVHLVVGSQRWMDLRQQIRDVIGTRIELRLGEASDSTIDRKAAMNVPDGKPGRGLEMSKHHMLLGLPRIDGNSDPSTVGAGVTQALQAIAEAAPHGPGPKLRLLPERIEVAELLALPGADPQGRGAAAKLVLGIEETRMGPLLFRPRVESHLLVLGDPKSGKSSFLRLLAREVMRTHSPKEAKIFAIDLRRAMLGLLPQDYTAAYITKRDDIQAQMEGLAKYLTTRLPGNDVTPEMLRDRSWWTGSEAWVLVDDYDLVVTSAGNPLLPLQPLLAQAADIGLHLIITRRMGGASRALYEPIAQSMNELGTTVMLLSGNPDDGAVIGRVKAVRSVPGRVQVISRDAGLQVAQLGWTPGQG